MFPGEIYLDFLQMFLEVVLFFEMAFESVEETTLSGEVPISHQDFFFLTVDDGLIGSESPLLE